MSPVPRLFALTLVTALLLTGCAANAPETPGAGVSADATPSETAAPPAPEVAAGEVVDAVTAEELNKAAGQLRGYAMPDGSYIVVDKTAPLPEAVQQDMNAKGNASQPVSDWREGTTPQNQAERQAISNLGAQQTGKTVIFVRRLPGYDYDNNPIVNYVPTGARLGSHGVIRTRADAEAVVAAKITSDPNAYAVIWPD